MVYHSRVSGQIISYAHDFCNKKVKENYYTVPVFAHNQFRFDFFLLLKGLQPTVWKTQEINIGGRNPSNVNFAIIRNQVKFIDTVKYFQQSLSNLAKSMTDEERKNIRNTCRSFIIDKLIYMSEEDEKFVLDYLCSGKGVISYQIIKKLNSLELQPENGDFFEQKDFYSTLNGKNVTDKEYTEVTKFFKIMKMKTLGDLNWVYNFQDVANLCEIFEKRATQLQNLFEYNPRKCSSASGFSGCVRRLQSKFVIALPTDAEIVRIFEKTLIGGYSCTWGYCEWSYWNSELLQTRKQCY